MSDNLAQQPVGGKWVQVIGFVYTKRIILNEAFISSSTNNESSMSQNNNNNNNTLVSLSKEIRKLILNLKSEALMDEEATKVNYTNLKKSATYQQYLQSIQKLKWIKRDELLNTNHSELKSFYINIYNSLLIHSIVENILNHSTISIWSRIHIYAKVSYQISDFYLSLNEIENGILRNNSYSAVPFTWRPFHTTINADGRLSLILPCDARIHFILNCGANSCPPIGVYSSEEKLLNKQLDLATFGFLSTNIKIHHHHNNNSSSSSNSNVNNDSSSSSSNNTISTTDSNNNNHNSTTTTTPTPTNTNNITVEISPIFKWYRTDFGRTDEEVLLWIVAHMRDDDKNKLILSDALKNRTAVVSKICYAVYDFNLNHN